MTPASSKPSMNEKSETHSPPSSNAGGNPATRRRFLMALGVGSFGASILMIAGGFLRFLRLNVFYEPSSKIRVGRPKRFALGSTTYLPDPRLFLFRDASGFAALSAVCPHLGCVVSQDGKGYDCPCHGSSFDATGKSLSGPGPGGLSWRKMFLSSDGYLIVDNSLRVDPDERLIVDEV